MLQLGYLVAEVNGEAVSGLCPRKPLEVGEQREPFQERGHARSPRYRWCGHV